MQKNRKNGIFSNVGYWVVMAASFWVQNAQADVRVIAANTDQSCFYGTQCKYTGTICPAGYVVTSCIGNYNNQHDLNGNPFDFNAYTPPPSPSVNPNYCPKTTHAICAKVCN